MRWSILSLNAVARSARLCRIALMLAILVPFAATSTVVAASFQDAATPPPAVVPGVAEQERLFDDLPVLLDRLGRVPVGRITFEPGATLSSDLIVVPLFAVVEEGTFEVTVDSVVTKVRPLDQVQIEADSRTIVENVGSITGSLITVAQLSMENFADFTLWGAPEFELAPGVVTNALALKISMLEVLAPKLLSVDLLDIPAGMAIDSLDFDGSTATESLVVVVVEGVIESDDGEMVAAGESVELYVDVSETTWRVVGAKATSVLIFRVGVAPED